MKKCLIPLFRCIRGFMSTSIKKSWKDSSLDCLLLALLLFPIPFLKKSRGNSTPDSDHYLGPCYNVIFRLFSQFCNLVHWTSRRVSKMNSLYQIHSKMLHGTKVIIFILWQLKKYWFIMKDPRLALSTSNMEVMSSNPSQATSFLFFPPKWLLSCYATFLS